jgi:MYXO-CTERM domain-containing protein
LGYRIALESGSSPLHLEDEAVLAYIEGDEAIIWLHWSDGDSDEQEPLRFTLTLRAVDSDGNLGPQSEPIAIQHAGKDEGCSLRSGRAGSSHLATLLALAALLGLRRRR